MIIGKSRTNQPVEPTEELAEGISEIVTDMVESGELENAKPIYCHPIQVKYTSGSRVYFFSCLIFNNDETAFTYETFYDYVLNLILTYNAVIMSSGSVWGGTKLTIATCIKNNYADGIGLFGLEPDGTENYYTVSKSDLSGASIFTDGVNKIN